MYNIRGSSFILEFRKVYPDIFVTFSFLCLPFRRLISIITTAAMEMSLIMKNRNPLYRYFNSIPLWHQCLF